MMDKTAIGLLLGIVIVLNMSCRSSIASPDADTTQVTASALDTQTYTEAGNNQSDPTPLRNLPTATLIVTVGSDSQDQASAIAEEAIIQYAQGVTAYEAGDINKALERFSAAIEIDPTMVDAYLYRSDIYKWRGEPISALIDCESAANLDPINAEVFFCLGAAHFYLDQPEDAIQAYSIAIELDPDNVSAYFSRADVYRVQEDFDRSIEDLNTVLELNEDEATAYEVLGLIYYDMCEPVLEILNIDKAQELGADNLIFNYRRALAYARNGEWDKAATDWEIYFGLVPNSLHVEDAKRTIRADPAYSCD